MEKKKTLYIIRHYLAHSAEQTKQMNISKDDAFVTRAGLAFGPGEANSKTSSEVAKVPVSFVCFDGWCTVNTLRTALVFKEKK